MYFNTVILQAVPQGSNGLLSEPYLPQVGGYSPPKMWSWSLFAPLKFALKILCLSVQSLQCSIHLLSES